MKILISEKLSQHRFKTPEGYLICTDAILARTGKQTYRRSEVFGDSCKDAEQEVEVDRPEKEVFSESTLASFENKPVTVEHPDVDVNSENYKDYAVGFTRDIHRGDCNGEPVILGTLVITDAQTIEEIENGEHTELSCGYDCDIVDSENPRQTNIRGNHVALCEKGRAGIARIVDSKIEDATHNLQFKLRPGLKIVREIKTYWLDDNRNFITMIECEEDGKPIYLIKNTYFDRNDPSMYSLVKKEGNPDVSFKVSMDLANDLIAKSKKKKDSLNDDSHEKVAIFMNGKFLEYSPSRESAEQRIARYKREDRYEHEVEKYPIPNGGYPVYEIRAVKDSTSALDSLHRYEVQVGDTIHWVYASSIIDAVKIVNNRK